MGPVKVAIIGYVVAGALLDVLVWRYRRFANWYLLFECVVVIIQGFVPFDYGKFQSIFLLMVMVQTFIEFATSTGSNILLCTATCLVIDVAIFPRIYVEDVTFVVIFQKILNALFCFIILTFIGMLITYITQ